LLSPNRPLPDRFPPSVVIDDAPAMDDDDDVGRSVGCSSSGRVTGISRADDGAANGGRGDVGRDVLATGPSGSSDGGTSSPGDGSGEPEPD